jgi:hypothetical protein
MKLISSILRCFIDIIIIEKVRLFGLFRPKMINFRGKSGDFWICVGVQDLGLAFSLFLAT